MPNPKIAEAGKATRFKPGTSPNPGGRPKKKHITEAYEKSLLLKAPEGIVKKLGLPEGSRWADVMAAGMVRSAVKGMQSVVPRLQIVQQVRCFVDDDVTIWVFGLLGGSPRVRKVSCDAIALDLDFVWFESVIPKQGPENLPRCSHVTGR